MSRAPRMMPGWTELIRAVRRHQVRAWLAHRVHEQVTVRLAPEIYDMRAIVVVELDDPDRYRWVVADESGIPCGIDGSDGRAIAWLRHGDTERADRRWWDRYR